jgi:hypothetical protein
MRSGANDQPTNPDNPWDEFTRLYDLMDARVVAILDEDGGAIVEAIPVLEICEGRMHTIGTDGKGQTTSSLDYGMSFGSKDEKPGDQFSGYEARIIISGKAANGLPMEIRGDGTIGHDENGRLDGMFHSMPSIYVPDDDDLKDHLGRMTDQWGGTPMGQFVMATYGRAQDWS